MLSTGLLLALFFRETELSGAEDTDLYVSLKGSKTSAKYSKTHQIIEGLQQGLYGGVRTKYK